LRCALGKLINHEAASTFLNSIDDPVVKSLLRYAYQTVCMSDAAPEGEFDLLYFFRIMEEFLRDREGVAKALKGEFEDNKTGWGA
jgi:hypothetical protein